MYSASAVESAMHVCFLLLQLIAAPLIWNIYPDVDLRSSVSPALTLTPAVKFWMRVGNLYYLNCLTNRQQANVADNRSQQTKEDVWHLHYGHLGELVDRFDYNSLRDVNFCEPSLEGKHYRRKFSTDGGKWSDEHLGLVHSDVCGKMNAKSLSAGEYFLTFTDDKSRYVWVYILKRKDEVFPCFLE